MIKDCRTWQSEESSWGPCPFDRESRATHFSMKRTSDLAQLSVRQNKTKWEFLITGKDQPTVNEPRSSDGPAWAMPRRIPRSWRPPFPWRGPMDVGPSRTGDASSLRRERRTVITTSSQPRLKIVVLRDTIRSHEDHATHGSSGEVHLSGMGQVQSFGIGGRTHTDHQLAPDDSEAHVSARHEAEAPEHFALRHLGIARHLGTNPLRQSFIECHLQDGNGREVSPALDRFASTRTSGRETVPVDNMTPLARVREIALCLPGVTEHVSHGAPCFFVRDKQPICYFHDHHGGDDRVTLWCPASPGTADELAAVDPERFFKPQPSSRGVFSDWVGVVLDPSPRGGVDWDEVAAIVKDAFRIRAPRRLTTELGDR